MDCSVRGEREREREREGIWIWRTSGVKGDEGLGSLPTTMRILRDWLLKVLVEL